MNIKDYDKKYKDLMTRMDEDMSDPSEDRHIISDGVMKPELYFNNPIRLAWMLKEPYDSENGRGGGWSYFEMFPEGEDLYLKQFNRGHKTTWHPIIYTTYSIKNGFIPWEKMKYIRDQHDMCDVVRETAFMNVQKLPAKGVTRTYTRDLWESISKHASLLKEQFNLLDPNVVIFGNTIDLYSDLLDLDLNYFKANGTCSFFIRDGKLYINAYHPAQTTVTRDKYINDIVKTVEMWSNKEI